MKSYGSGQSQHGFWRPFLEALEARLVPTNLPEGFTETLYAGGMGLTTAMAFAPDSRLFVCEQAGDLRVIDAQGQLLPSPFVHVDVNTSGERGLLGVAFDPDFTDNQYVYVYYTTAAAPIHNRVSRFTADGDVAQANSEIDLLDLDNLDANNHNGGAIHFGLDGKLYIGVGENAVPDNAQNLGNLLGKILRINPDGSIPPDNPFVGVEGARGEIWALGFRNPFTFDVQPGAGRIFVNDVGSDPPNAREEINYLVKGGNYGWPIYEGYSDDPNFVSPLYAYASGQGDGTCAIVGGSFYNPANRQFPNDYWGTYFFSDLCAGWIKRFDGRTGTVTDFATDTPPFTVDVKVDANGSLYYLYNGGIVYRIDYTGTSPTAVAPASAVVFQASKRSPLLTTFGAIENHEGVKWMAVDQLLAADAGLRPTLATNPGHPPVRPHRTDQGTRGWADPLFGDTSF